MFYGGRSLPRTEIDSPRVFTTSRRRRGPKDFLLLSAERCLGFAPSAGSIIYRAFICRRFYGSGDIVDIYSLIYSLFSVCLFWEERSLKDY